MIEPDTIKLLRECDAGIKKMCIRDSNYTKQGMLITS